MKHNSGFLKLVEEARQQIKECTIDEAKASWIAEKDSNSSTCEDNEYAQDHAHGARHLGRGILERDIETVISDKQADIVLYCGVGYRSTLAAKSLRQMGYSNVTSMIGGIEAWRDAGYPMDQQ